jgi:hypothetical protein
VSETVQLNLHSFEGQLLDDGGKRRSSSHFEAQKSLTSTLGSNPGAPNDWPVGSKSAGTWDGSYGEHGDRSEPGA